MDDTLTIEFRQPVEHKGQTYTSITLSEPTGGQMLKINGRHGIDATIHLIADNAVVPVDVIRGLPVSQISEAAEFLAGFTPTGRQDT